MKHESLIVIDKWVDIGKLGFPIPISDTQALRTKENEAEHRHLTFLILPILTLEENRILIINKAEKNKRKDPEHADAYPSLCLDIAIGGHGVLELVPEHERTSGILSMESAVAQAYRELNEELALVENKALPFEAQDLTLLGLCSYPVKEPSPQKTVSNRELSVLFGLEVRQLSSDFEVQDSVIENGEEVQIKLPCFGYRYDELLSLWENRELHTGEYRIEDGLSRLLETGHLPQMVSEKMNGRSILSCL